MDDEIKGEGNSANFEARMYDPRLGRWLTRDPKEYSFPGISTYAFCFNNPVYFIDPNGKEPTPSEAALMAKDVYGGLDAANAVLTGGWRASSTNVADVTWSAESGFKSKLYERVDADGNVIEYSYVTAGTENSLDWGTNAIQKVGLSAQHELSVANAKAIAFFLGEAMELTFVGHSLGGGLAAANAYATGLTAITFNPANLSDATKENLDISEASNTNDSDVKNYVVAGEIVSLTNFFTDGETDFIMSFKVSNVLDGPVEKHSIDYVIDVFKEQGAYDVKSSKSSSGSGNLPSRGTGSGNSSNSTGSSGSSAGKDRVQGKKAKF